jgi:hypothetical protein
MEIAMMGLSNLGVQIRMADGGYIVQWLEPRKLPVQESAEPRGYLEQERQSMGGFPASHMMMVPPRYKCAVRVKLEDALKLAGEVLERLQKLGVEDGIDPTGDFISGA